MGVCRLRMKVVCNYGLEFQKALKNAEVSVLINGDVLSGTSDTEGIMDGSFDCPLIPVFGIAAVKKIF